MTNRLPEALWPLTKQRHWVAWKWTRGRKIPLQPARASRYARTTDPSTWGSYAEAKRADRIGFVLLNSRIGALDLDDCRDPDTGRLDHWARRLVEKAASYCETTPSGRGIRIIGRANGPPVHTAMRKGAGKLEVYRDCPRYITVTGDQIGRCRRLKNIDWLIDELAPPKPKRTFQTLSIDKLVPGRTGWRTILKRYGLISLSFYVRHPVTEGKRSDVIWKLGRSLAERGASVAEIATVLAASQAWQSKHADTRRALERETARIIAKR